MAKELVFRNIAQNKGRKIVISPETADLELLSVGYINLDSEVPKEKFSTGNNETVLMCMKGEATVLVEKEQFTLGIYDTLYIPRDAAVTVSTKKSASILESSAPVSKRHPLYYVQWSNVKDDPKRHASIGPETMHRELFQIISEDVEAGRILQGPTFSNKGNWTSWPPHEHRDTLEEVYVYFNMPSPAFAIQLAYNNTQYPDAMFAVRENDAVVVHHGYHPNVAIPGYPVNFVWILCAKKEEIDRKWGVVNVQPEFKA